MSTRKDKYQSVINTAGKEREGGGDYQPQDILVPDTGQLLAQNQQTAHQLNNQLGIIRGNLEMLSLELSLSGKSEQRLVKINAAIDAASDIVTSLHSHSGALTSGNRNDADIMTSQGFACDAVSREGQINQQQKTVLIVDDEEDLVEVVMRQLQFRGFRTCCATSAEAAIEILATDPDIDIVFSDVVMNNGMNGLQLARYVFDNYPDIKILLTTGHTQQLEKSQHSHDELIGSLLMAKLPKPFTHQELVNAIHELL